MKAKGLVHIMKKKNAIRTAKKIKKEIGFVFTTICFLFLAWIFISFIDVNMNNGLYGTGPNAWNFFEIMLHIFR